MALCDKLDTNWRKNLELKFDEFNFLSCRWNWSECGNVVSAAKDLLFCPVRIQFITHFTFTQLHPYTHPHPHTLGHAHTHFLPHSLSAELTREVHFMDFYSTPSHGLRAFWRPLYLIQQFEAATWSLPGARLIIFTFLWCPCCEAVQKLLFETSICLKHWQTIC